MEAAGQHWKYVRVVLHDMVWKDIGWMGRRVWRFLHKKIYPLSHLVSTYHFCFCRREGLRRAWKMGRHTCDNVSEKGTCDESIEERNIQ